VTLGSRAFEYGLIVDLDDTLYEREQFVHSGLMAVGRYVQEHRPVSAIDAFAAMTAARRNGAAGRELQVLCARFGWSEDEVQLLLEVFREHRPMLRLPGETVTALSQVRADGWRIVVLTNGLPRVQRAKVSALGLGAFVDAVVYAEEHAPGGKPARAAFRAALARLSLPPERCVCAGDDAACDIAGAQAMGIRTVWLTPELDGVVGSGPVPDAQIASIGDLPMALTELMKMVKSDAA
jgi:putative hydrolase of the HAD superfamily